MHTQTPHPHLIAVDWGTSSFRAALMVQGAVVEHRHNDQGILNIQPGGFASALTEFCGDWMQTPNALTLICGMAGSAQGWQLAPYLSCPCALNQLAHNLVWLKPQQLALVPGISCELPHAPDVMRGEETQVLGALQLTSQSSATVVLPGTHSKWITVKEGKIERFATYMTGEWYALLGKHSILSRTLPQALSPSDTDPMDLAAFDQGVLLAQKGQSILHTIFSVRTRSLMDRQSPTQAQAYLSGLLIGEELRAQAADLRGPLVVIANPALQQRYLRALNLLGAQCQVMGDEATWQGLHSLATNIWHQNG
jgi:2-dehydro-3-deoxygalactonokinase